MEKFNMTNVMESFHMTNCQLGKPVFRPGKLFQ